MSTPPCADVPELHFTAGLVATEAARAMCATCPARQRCAELGAGEPFGIFGGLDPAERAALNTDDGALFDVAAVEVMVEHTRASYVAGAHHDCEQCRRANRKFVAEHRQRTDRPRVTRRERLQQQTGIDLGVSA